MLAQGNQKISLLDNLNDIELPKEASKQIKSTIQKAQKDIKKLKKSLDEKNREFKELMEWWGGHDEHVQRRNQLQKQIFDIQYEMQLKVRDVKLEFFTMIQKIIHSFTTKDMLPDFKGADTKSGHMTKFIKFELKRDIFQFIDKKHDFVVCEMGVCCQFFARQQAENVTLRVWRVSEWSVC